MKDHKFKVGDIVGHSYSKEYTGEVHDVRNDVNGYDYFVRFIDENDDSYGAIPVMKDWFKEEVLTRRAESDYE